MLFQFLQLENQHDQVQLNPIFYLLIQLQLLSASILGYWQTTIGVELKGKILGLIGLGRVGFQVAKIGKAFGMEVMAWSENLSLDKCKELGVLPCSKEDLIQNSDFLSVHVQGGERYRDCIKLAEFDKMKKTAFLINTSREMYLLKRQFFSFYQTLLALYSLCIFLHLAHEQIENLSFELNLLCYKVKHPILYIYPNLSFRSKP